MPLCRRSAVTALYCPWGIHTVACWQPVKTCLSGCRQRWSMEILDTMVSLKHTHKQGQQCPLCIWKFITGYGFTLLRLQQRKLYSLINIAALDQLTACRRHTKGEVELSFSGKTTSSSLGVIKGEHGSNLNETIKYMRGLAWFSVMTGAALFHCRDVETLLSAGDAAAHGCRVSLLCGWSTQTHPSFSFSTEGEEWREGQCYLNSLRWVKQ